MEGLADGVGGLEEWEPALDVSTQTTEMDLHSGSKDLTVPSLMFVTMPQGTFLYHGNPPRIPSDLDLLGKFPQSATPNLDLGRIGEMRDQVTTLGGLGQPKNEADLLPASLSPSHFSESTMWEERNGRINIPTNHFGMCNVKR